MNKYIITELKSDNFDYLLTILDYEVNLNTLLNDFFSNINNHEDLKVIIDTTLKTGLTEYRFISNLLDYNGKIKEIKHVTPDETIKIIANTKLASNKELLFNSILLDYQIEEILESTISC